MGIYDSAWGFVNAIKSTREFSELIQAKSNIEKNPSLKNEVYEFNRKLGEIYSSNMSANMIETKVSELNKQFGSLSRILEVDRFLKASKAFNDMMAKVYKTVNEAIEADLKLK
jgi:cell fate (sporulation/competence/biofilm development) regulator YlbF (YheA/YmcA/DUF963 family)